MISPISSLYLKVQHIELFLRIESCIGFGISLVMLWAFNDKQEIIVNVMNNRLESEQNQRWHTSHQRYELFLKADDFELIKCVSHVLYNTNCYHD